MVVGKFNGCRMVGGQFESVGWLEGSLRVSDGWKAV